MRLLLVLVGLAQGWRGPSPWWLASGWLMLVGMALFSFNIYARSLLGFDALRALVPWGGSAWIAACEPATGSRLLTP